MAIIIFITIGRFDVISGPSLDFQEIQQGIRRKCPHCDEVIPSEERTCPKCGEKLPAPLYPITHDKVEVLLKSIDRQSLTSSSEEYFNRAQAYAYDWQVPEAAQELGKVLLVSKPKSEVHRKAERLLKKMGYRF